MHPKAGASSSPSGRGRRLSIPMNPDACVHSTSSPSQSPAPSTHRSHKVRRRPSLSLPMNADDVCDQLGHSPVSPGGESQSPSATSSPHKTHEVKRRPSVSLPMNGDDVCDQLGNSPASPGESPQPPPTSSHRGTRESPRRRRSSSGLRADMPKNRWKARDRWALFIFYFVLTGNDGIVKARSKRLKDGELSDDFPYSLASVMFMSCLVSLCTGIFITIWNEGIKQGIQECLNRRSILLVAPINCLFQVAFVLKFEALRRLDPDIVSILSQANLILLAFAARVILNRHYKKRQWFSLVFISLSMCVYIWNRDGKPKEDASLHLPDLAPTHLSAYCIVVTMCVIEIAATMCAEVFLKSCHDSKVSPFYVQKVHVDISGLCIMLTWILLQKYASPGPKWDWIFGPLRSQQICDNGILDGWDRWTVAVLITVVLKAWLAGLVAKRFDSVVKQIGSCLAIALTYVEVVVWIDPSASLLSRQTLICFVMVLSSLIFFSLSGKSSDKGRRNSPDSQEFAGNYSGMKPPMSKGEAGEADTSQNLRKQGESSLTVRTMHTMRLDSS